MFGYLVFEITEIIDAQKYEGYRQLVPPTIRQYGGRFLVRGGKVEGLEGNWAPLRIGIVEFDSPERAKAWYNSPEYEPLKLLRREAVKARILIVEGAETKTLH
jgi:uncharacterized protein (DUF1330 family)